MKTAERIVRVVVPNDGIMEEATNAYIVGSGPIVVFDPGSAAGTEAILEALARLGDPPVRDIILTHAHPDHAGGAAALRAVTGAPVWLHPDELEVAERMGLKVPVDHELADGAAIKIGAITFDAVLTPGHAAGHVVFMDRASGATIAGDLVHGAGTVGIFPPYGSMTAYLASLQRMIDRGATHLLPGHGPEIDDGPAYLRYYIEHRLAREEQIIAALKSGLTAVDDIVALLYPDILPGNTRAADATVRAHLEKLIAEGRVRQVGEKQESRYFLTDELRQGS